MELVECKQFVNNIMGFIDKELDHETMHALENHLELCPECKSFVDTYKKMLKMSGSLKNKKFVTPDIRMRLKKLLESKLKIH
ncbi:MAG: anti-sigma factor family protein [Thermodesulfobacteriota bacterium]